MKRQYLNNRSWPRGGCFAAVLAAAGLLFAACNEAPEDEASGRPLPEGAYPLALTAAVTPATRATADDAWRGGEQVAVEAASGNAPAVVKTYTVAADGALNPADAADRFWWRSTDEQKRLRAWYCGDGSSAAGGANAATVPTAWSVAADQSGDGVTAGSADDGYQASDLLFAPAVTATFGSAAVPLRFYHQTAKVLVQIKNAEYVTDAAQIRSVRFGDKNLALSGSYAAPTVAGATTGAWMLGEADAEIVPRRLATTPAGYVAVYEALVIPQSLDGERLVAVETAAGTMYYTPAAGDAQLGAGKEHTYNITVRADRLQVEVVRGEEWKDDGSEEIESQVVYSASDLKTGDYFYSDGTTSDGGLRKLYTDGSLKMADVKPAPAEGKTVIGIVFQTDPERIGQAEKDALGGTARGLVIAVKHVGEDVAWCTKRTDTDLPNFSTLEAYYNDINGLSHTKTIWSSQDYTDDPGTYPAFKAVVDFTVPAPDKTTGWYLPSIGQLWDVFDNLGHVPVLRDPDIRTSQVLETEWQNQGDITAALNGWMADVDPDDKNVFPSNLWIWSSTEGSGTSAMRWFVRSIGFVDCYTNDKVRNSHEVRPVLAF